MAGHMEQSIDHRKRQMADESPRKHIVAFVLSIMFTAFAFLAVIFLGKSPFIAPFLIVLAVIQAAFQLYIWMHMDQKGHGLPSIGIYFGFIVAVVSAVTFVYWLGGY